MEEMMQRFDYDEIDLYFYIIDHAQGFHCPLAHTESRDNAIRIVDALNAKENAE